MLGVPSRQLAVLLLCSMAGAAIASADRMSFPDDPKAYEPPKKVKSVPKPSVPVVEPSNEERPQPAKPDDNQPAVATKPPVARPPSSKRIATHDRGFPLLEPSVIGVAVGIAGAILLVGLICERPWRHAVDGSRIE